MAEQKTINGLNIIASSPSKTSSQRGMRPASIILVDLGGTDTCSTHVTGLLGDGDGEWAWGHYFSNILEAIVDYRERADRGF